MTVVSLVSNPRKDVKKKKTVALPISLGVEVLTVTDNVGKADAAAMYREIGGTDPGQG